MTLAKQRLFARLMAPAGADGADAGGTDTADRGDDLDVAVEDDPKDVKDALKDPFEDEDEDKEDEDKAEKDGEDKPKAKAKDSRIPLARHKDILAKERAQRDALEQRLAQYEKGSQVAKTNEDLTKAEDAILGMEKQYNQLLADGEVEKASELMSKIRRAEREVVETKAEMRAQVAEARARESARYDIVLERIEESYPALNPDADEFDSELMQDVVDLKDVYQRRGMTPTKAMQAAVKKLLGQETSAQKGATDVTPRVDAKDVATERKRSATAKATDAARRTPPSSRDVGIDSDKAGILTAKDVIRLDQDKFAKLAEDQLAKLRGDEV